MKKPRFQVTAQSLWLPERETLLQEKKEIQVIINTKLLTLLFTQPFTEHGKQTFMLDLFGKQPTCPNSLGLITEKEEGDASSKFNTYTNNRFLVYLRGLS